MAISDKLQELITIKQDIKEAIENKGVDMTGVAFNGYAAKVGGIPLPKEEQTKSIAAPNFSSGNVVVTPDANKVLTQVTLVKDSDLVPANIVKDVNIFGVVGTASLPKVEETKTVTPNFSSGNVVVTPDTGKVLTQVTVNKDANFIASNLKKDVTVFGITGTLERQILGYKKIVNGDVVTFEKITEVKEEQEKSVTITQNGTSTVSPDTGKTLSEVEIVVNVPTPTPTLQEKTATENGDVVADNGYDGLSKVVVNVQSSGGMNDLCYISRGALSKQLANIACGVINDKCYLFGGELKSSPWGVNTIYEYDFNTDLLTTKTATFPITRFYAASCGVVNGKCYIFGGHNGSSAVNTIYEYDPSTDTLTLKTATLPQKRLGTSCGVVDGKCYIFGGQENSTRFICEYDPSTDTLILKTNFSVYLQYSSCGVVNNKCYIFGGYGLTFYNTIYEYDPSTDTLITKTATFPQTIYGTSCGVVNNKCYIFGGYGLTFYNTIYEYDPSTDILITKSATLPIYIRYTGCGASNNKCYIFGGGTSTDGTSMANFSDKIYVYL